MSLKGSYQHKLTKSGFSRSKILKPNTIVAMRGIKRFRASAVGHKSRKKLADYYKSRPREERRALVRKVGLER